MYIEKRKSKNKEYFVMIERYTDPLTNVKRRASVVFYQDTPRGRREAERELIDKIDKIILERNAYFDSKVINTFGALKKQWLDSWQTTVKKQTVERECLVLKRLEEIISDEFLLKNITPLLVQNCLNEYKQNYNATHSTMQHIKSTLNKIFDYGVLHNAIPYSPSKVVKLRATVEEKRQKKERLESKFLNESEVKVFLSEMKNVRNQNYYDLTLFMIATGCRIGEASAITENDIDFEKKVVKINKSLQSHDLRVDEYYLDTTKTEAGEREELLPDFAIEALYRVIERNKAFTEHIKANPSNVFRETEFIFKTEYGAPITSHTFREVLSRVNKSLKMNCLEKYGFEWTKNVVPHSFRHIHITVLVNGGVALKEVQKRVGHVEVETTNGYTHLMQVSQKSSVNTITKFYEGVEQL